MLETPQLVHEPPPSRPGVAVEVVIPVYNEQEVLAANVQRLREYLLDTLPYSFRITIADNGSTDDTWEITQRLAQELPEVTGVKIEGKGRGRALRHVWSTTDAEVVSYLDADLSISLDAFLPLVAPLLTGHSDLAIGTRYTSGATVERPIKRAILSRTYNLMLRTTLGARFSDAQCGFKAARTEIVRALMPVVEDDQWFFDTELLLIAEQHGLRIHEVAVDVSETRPSSVDIVRTVLDDLRGMARVARRILSGAIRVPVPPRVAHARLPQDLIRQIARFSVVGVVSTLAHLLLYLWLRMLMPAITANTLALALTAIANTAANRKFTFGVLGRAGAIRHQLEGGGAFLISLGLSSGSLLLLHMVTPGASSNVELAAVFFGDSLATLARFMLLRSWVFHPMRLTRWKRSDTISEETTQ